ncbi:MAG TPA: class D sortase [Clostridiaceae bacterium]|nr:class D sortase [Clostridiaceae bacterium]
MQKQNNNIAMAKKWQTIEATIIDVIVAFIIVIAIIFTTKIIFGKQIKKAIEVVDMISIKTDSSVVPEIKFDTEKSTITNYPEYGSRYGNIKIESLDINLPLYYGDKLSILKNGVGQSSGSYFPGEGGSIICMGHNTKAFLYKLPQIKKGAIIEVETTYGTFKYKVDNTKIVNMYNVDELPIQKDEEVLMLYTCYPVNGLGHKTDRYVVYAKKVE